MPVLTDDVRRGRKRRGGGWDKPTHLSPWRESVAAGKAKKAKPAKAAAKKASK